MLDLPNPVRALADDLARVRGTVGVVLGGSRARGRHRPDSDIDLGLYYDGATFDWHSAVGVLERHDTAHDPKGLAPPGTWGPWMNGGAWLEIEARAVDVLLRDIGFVQGIIGDACEGRFSSSYQIGHPHGWHSFMVLSEVHHNRPIAGDRERLSALQQRTVPYPPALRTAVADKFLFEARFTSMLLRKLEGREEPTHSAGLSYRCVMCIVHVLYALNETYLVNEKGAVDGTTLLGHVPPNFAARAHAVAALSDTSRAIRNAALAALVDEVEALVREHMKLKTSWDATSFPA